VAAKNKWTKGLSSAVLLVSWLAGWRACHS
jgi:hypothetical protein